MFNPHQALLIIAAMALGTLITRFLPFLLFPNKNATPKYIVYLGQVLPYATIGLLIIYCLKNVSLLAAPHGLPELLAICLTALLQLWKNNSLLSIGSGTLAYMLLLQTIFA